MTNEDNQIAVVLPAYNEAATIVDCIESFHAAVPEAWIYVVDNNSSDETGALAAEALLTLDCPGAVINEPRQGKGNAVRRAFADIEADVYLLADADMTYPAERARDLIAPLLADQADMVVGNRLAAGCYAEQNTRRFHDVGNRTVRRLVNALFGARLDDIMSGYRAVNALFVTTYPILVEGFEIETDMTLHALDKRFRIQELPVDYKDRPEGSTSKLRTVSDGARVVFTIAQILRYYRPLLFFGLLSLVALILAVLAGSPAVVDYIRTRFVYHVPLAVLASGLAIVAVITFGIGLMLDSLANQQRRDFERHLLQCRRTHSLLRNRQQEPAGRRQ